MVDLHPYTCRHAQKKGESFLSTWPNKETSVTESILWFHGELGIRILLFIDFALFLYFQRSVKLYV